MQTISSARRQALALIGQAPPLGLEVVDFWGSGWCRLRVKVPQGASRITAATYEWLKERGLITEARYGQPITTGRERNRRYATITDAGRALIGSADRTDRPRNEESTMAAPHTKPIDSMNIPGTFEVFDTQTGRWKGTSAEFKSAEVLADQLNQGLSYRRYDWWVVQ